ncbi:cellulose binding domain-containing protein [Phytohabitans rumicis]|uniref:CBM2 domain-containing protein n=1 Tax=Phytohabitans rumicis TaxID=1076125 RepID=A0A6V8LEB3_9ACTN|nr:cellulose binding domain-containing protein [Phytohabitans rumicis]GFJ95582.1 hypothetical protein Prum_092240 [Phytohabitans rumicis]
MRTLHSIRPRLSAAVVATVVALAGMVAFAGATATPAYAASGCRVEYRTTWATGTQFGTSILFTNTGDALNGWELQFAFPGDQRVTAGWPVTWSQALGSNEVTAASNAPWSDNLATGASITLGFYGTHGGTNTDPTVFTVNGTTCLSVPAANQPPAISITSPQSGQLIQAPAPVQLAATAIDDHGVARVEFRVDGTLVLADTTAPYAGVLTGFPAGDHVLEATAIDNGEPPLRTSARVPFHVAAPTGALVVTPTSLVVPDGGQSFFVVQMTAPPPSAVIVFLTRTGDPGITCIPTTIVLTPTNWSTGVVITCTATVGPPATTVYTLSATGYSSVSTILTRP